MLIFYKEKNGDYICVERSTIIKTFDGKFFEGRAVCIEGSSSSVATTMVHEDYIKENCKRVAKKNVPETWRKNLLGK